MFGTLKQDKKMLTLALAAGLSLGQAQFTSAAATSDVEKLLAEASASLEAARKNGNSWTSTDKLMTAAREALASGDIDQANELASRALLTADKAQEQSRAEQHAWQARVPNTPDQ